MKGIIAGTLLFLLAATGVTLYQSQIRPQPVQTTATYPSEGLVQTANADPIPCSGQAIPSQTEGPYYTENSPQTTNFYRSDLPGEKVTLEGFVVDTECKPIANAWIDFWQADGNGNYDNEGYTLRGHQYTNGEGKFTLTTVIPGEYPGRTPHIHFKVRANVDAETITSQLYLPNAESNTNDAIFDQRLVMDIQNTQDGKLATYTIVINR